MYDIMHDPYLIAKTRSQSVKFSANLAHSGNAWFAAKRYYMLLIVGTLYLL